MNNESKIFNTYLVNQGIIEEIKKLNLKEVTVSPTALSNMLDIIKRKFKYHTVKPVIEGILNGDIIVIKPEDYYKIPVIFPVWLNQAGHDIRAIVNIGSYKELKLEDNVLDGNTTLFFSLAQAGAIIRNIHLHTKVYQNNIRIVTLSMKAYSNLFIKALDKLYAININIKEMEDIRCKVNMFFLTFLLGKENNETTEKLALSTIEEVLRTKSDLSEIGSMNLEDFLSYLSKEYVSLKKLNFKDFIKSWMDLYSANSILSIELYNYFIAIMIGYPMIGSRIVKGTIIERSIEPEVMLNLFNEVAAKLNS